MRSCRGNVRGLALLSAGAVLQSHRRRTVSLGRHGPLCCDRNFGDHPHAIHGVGWQRAWEVAAVGAASATLTLRHDAVGEQARSWPFAFAAEQRFVLTPDALHVRLSLRNLHRSAGAVPASACIPIFRATAARRCASTRTQVWLNGAERAAVGIGARAAASGIIRGSAIGSAALDNCFAGWDGEARITWADGVTALRIEAERLFRHLVVYTPPAPGLTSASSR